MTEVWFRDPIGASFGILIAAALILIAYKFLSGVIQLVVDVARGMCGCKNQDDDFT